MSNFMIFTLTIEIKEDFKLFIMLVKNTFNFALLDEFFYILSFLGLIFYLVLIVLKISKHLLGHLVMKLILSLLVIHFSLPELFLCFL